MIQFYSLFIFWISLSCFSIALILLRDDSNDFIKDINESFIKGFQYGIAILIVYLLYAPVTLPYSIKYFIEKWKKN